MCIRDRDKIFTIGEKISIRRFLIVDGVLSTYIHGKGQTGVIVKFEADDAAKNAEGFAEYSKNVALQVAAMNCEYVDPDHVPAAALDVVEEEVTEEAPAEEEAAEEEAEEGPKGL